MSNVTLGLQPPERLYTMPEQEVHHFITAADLKIIKTGGVDKLFHLSLALFGAAFGFFQNVYELGSDIWKAKAISGGEVLGGLLFVGCLVGALSLYLSCRQRTNPLDELVKEIEKRQARPYGMAGR